MREAARLLINSVLCLHQKCAINRQRLPPDIRQIPLSKSVLLPVIPADVLEEPRPAGELLAELDEQGLEATRVSGHFFGEGEESTFLRREIAGIAPGVEGIDPLFGLAGCAGIAGVHVDTEGAAIDLGSSDLDELLVDWGKPGGLDIVGKIIQYFVGGGFDLVDFDSCVHN